MSSYLSPVASSLVKGVGAMASALRPVSLEPEDELSRITKAKIRPLLDATDKLRDVLSSTAITLPSIVV